MFETIHYTVAGIDGDYANLTLRENPDSEPKLVARALLPEGVEEGSKLIYEWMEYRMED